MFHGFCYDDEIPLMETFRDFWHYFFYFPIDSINNCDCEIGMFYISNSKFLPLVQIFQSKIPSFFELKKKSNTQKCQIFLIFLKLKTKIHNFLRQFKDYRNFLTNPIQLWLLNRTRCKIKFHGLRYDDDEIPLMKTFRDFWHYFFLLSYRFDQ